jgi:hypothetical protein
MRVWHAEAANRVALEIELDEDDGLVSYHPPVVSGLD